MINVHLWYNIGTYIIQSFKYYFSSIIMTSAFYFLSGHLNGLKKEKRKWERRKLMNHWSSPIWITKENKGKRKGKKRRREEVILLQNYKFISTIILSFSKIDSNIKIIVIYYIFFSLFFFLQANSRRKKHIFFFLFLSFFFLSFSYFIRALG